MSELRSPTFEEAYRDGHSSDDILTYCQSNYSLREVITTLQDDRVVCKLAYKKGVPVGFFLLKHHNCPILLKEDSSELKQIYVLSSEYGGGMGRLLFDDAITCTNNANSSWIWLLVPDSNQRAQSFYRKRKFESIGIGPELIVGTDRLPSTIMALKV